MNLDVTNVSQNKGTRQIKRNYSAISALLFGVSENGRIVTIDRQISNAVLINEILWHILQEYGTGLLFWSLLIVLCLCICHVPSCSCSRDLPCLSNFPFVWPLVGWSDFFITLCGQAFFQINYIDTKIFDSFYLNSMTTMILLESFQGNFGDKNLLFSLFVQIRNKWCFDK